jgi:hypothetical protein
MSVTPPAEFLRPSSSGIGALGMAGTIDVAGRWDALSFFCTVGSKFGLCTPSELHLDFNAYRPDGAWGNVYSVYFSFYPNYGLLGVVAFMVFYGMWIALHHERASHSLANTLVAAYLMSAIVTSIFNDLFLPALNLLIKAYLVGVLVPLVWRPRNAASRVTYAATLGRPV